MKKIFSLLIACAAFISTAQAEGYQVNTLSAKQLGMGHTGVSQKLNSESVWFNPAAASFQEQKFHISAGVTGIDSHAEYRSINNYTDPVSVTKSDNPLSTPLYFYANYKIAEDWSLGLSFNTPFGSSMNWGDSWAGAHLIQDISLQAYSLQPTVSYKFLNDKMAVGVGVMVSWGTFNLSRSLLPTSMNSTIAAMVGDYGAAITAVGDNPLVSTEVSGDANVAVGFNVGLMYNIDEHWTVGASYRSKMMMKVDEGHAELNYANSTVETILGATGMIPSIDKGTFSAELPLPATLSVGVTYQPTDEWQISLETQWVQWKAYDMLTLEFNEKELLLENIESVKNYSNTIITRLGSQYKANDYITARLGLYVDQSPVASDYFNPETPSMTKVGYTGGLSIYPCKETDFSIDLSYAYVTSADPERTGSYPDAYSANGVFQGNYSVYAHTVAVGVSWGF